MADKLMYNPNDDTQKTFCKFRLLVETFQKSSLWINQSELSKVPKFARKHCYKTFGTSVINSPLSPQLYSY